MREAGIAARTKRKFRQTTDSNHALPVAENVLDRDFNPDEPNTSWVADVTYIPAREGWLYLAVVEDLFSRKVVGWSMDQTMTSRLVADALEMALARRLKGSSSSGLVAHSDLGSQYASEHYQRRLAEGRITCSMSRGNCWDNAAMESFSASLKKELVHDEDYATHEEAKASIFEYIEAFYNRVRRHSSLGYVAPDEYERTHNQTLKTVHYSGGTPTRPRTAGGRPAVRKAPPPTRTRRPRSSRPPARVPAPGPCSSACRGSRRCG
jgi:transposase InsO family protein